MFIRSLGYEYSLDFEAVFRYESGQRARSDDEVES